MPRSESLFFVLYVQHICTYSRQRLWWWVWHQELAAPNPPSRNSANNCANYCTSQRLDVTYAWVAVVFEAPPQLSLSNPKAAATPHFHSPITHAHTRAHQSSRYITLAWYNIFDCRRHWQLLLIFAQYKATSPPSACCLPATHSEESSVNCWIYPAGHVAEAWWAQIV